MNVMHTSAFEIARRFVGIEEVPGMESNPMILAMLKLDGDWPEDDSVPWCSAFMNWVCWLLRLPRSKSYRARSWLNVGYAINFLDIEPGFDIVILKRGSGDQPGPTVINAPGHVGFYAGHDANKIELLGGNQGDSVKVSRYDSSRILGLRRLYRSTP